MPFELQYHTLNAEQQNKYLDIILRNTNLYNEFLDFAEKRHQAEEVRFLREMTRIPWNGNTPLTADMERGRYVTYIKAGGFYQVNIHAAEVEKIREAVDSEQTPDWGPVVMEVRRLVRNNRLVVDFLKAREAKAQAAAG
jgi:hypothetical protein